MTVKRRGQLGCGFGALQRGRVARAGLAVRKGAELAADAATPPRLSHVDGHIVGEDGCVYVSGRVVPVSRMSVPQLRAELAARGLPADGLRTTLYRRVQARPAAAPRAPCRMACSEAAGAQVWR